MHTRTHMHTHTLTHTHTHTHTYTHYAPHTCTLFLYLSRSRTCTHACLTHILAISRVLQFRSPSLTVQKNRRSTRGLRNSTFRESFISQYKVQSVQSQSVLNSERHHGGCCMVIQGEIPPAQSALPYSLLSPVLPSLATARLSSTPVSSLPKVLPPPAQTAAGADMPSSVTDNPPNNGLTHSDQPRTDECHFLVLPARWTLQGKPTCPVFTGQLFGQFGKYTVRGSTEVGSR